MTTIVGSEFILAAELRAVLALLGSYSSTDEHSCCGTDLLITMSIWSAFPGHRPLELRKTG
jgi:hypothetical protein